MERERTSTRSRRTPGRGKSSAKRSLHSRPRASSVRPKKRIPHSPASAHAAFTAAFTEYWRAIQVQQAALMTRTQEAYAGFMTKLQEIWKEDPMQARFTERCVAFAEALRQTNTAPDAVPDVEAAYREYIEQLRDAWTESDLQLRIEDLYLAITETVQKATEESQQKLEDARRAYLEKLCAIWTDVSPDQMDADALSRVSRNMMVTVFFSEGMRPADATLPVPEFT